MRRYHVLFKHNHETVMAMALYANSAPDAAMIAEHQILEDIPNVRYDEIEVKNYFKTESEVAKWEN